MQESKETHISNHLDEIVAAVSVTPRKKIQNKLPQTALFQPPREKLHLCEEKAKSYSSSHKHKEAVHELVRCIALTRICYGDSHWKLAEAHINLAQGYLQLKGLSLQAKQHAEKAKEILTNSLMPPYNDNTDVFKCSIELFHTMGRALLSLQKFKEASENLSKAERLAKELLQCGRIIKEEWIEIQARIKLSSAQMYQSQKKSKEALPHYQEALEYIEISRGEKSLECVSILRELAGVEQSLGFYDASINHFLQAHLIVLSKNPSQEEAAVSAHFVAHASIASGRPEHHDVAEQYFQESMANLKDAEGMGKAKFLSIQDDYCHFLQVIGQKEKATSILRESLEAKVAVFGDLSPKVAETYRLLGGTDLAQGNHSGAHKKLKKCLQIQTLLYGPQDKRTLATQQTMDVLAKAPEVAVKPRQTPRAKAAFCGCAAQHGRWDSIPSRLFAPTGNRAAPPTPGGPHWDLGDPSGDLVLQVLGSSTGTQLLPPKHHLLFYISIHLPEQSTPTVMISVEKAKTSLRLAVVFHH
uniref:Tetratricopeptide repeat domain 23 n=1 Tax=Canis lupus familiaris TaxID=9615 RepID=A0A8C0R9R8_CANLF